MSEPSRHAQILRETREVRESARTMLERLLEARNAAQRTTSTSSGLMLPSVERAITSTERMIAALDETIADVGELSDQDFDLLDACDAA